MQRSPQLAAAGILIAIGSCLALIVSLFVFFSLQLDFPFGWRFSADYLARISIGIFGFFAFVWGLITFKQMFNRKKFVFSVLGATLVLLVGSIFFIRMIVSTTTRLDYPQTWWTTLIEYVIFPLVVCASISLVLLISRRREFECTKSTLLTASGALMILCSITAALLGVISYASYQEAFTHPYSIFQLPAYTMIISVLALVCGLPSGILFLKKKFTMAIILTVLVIVLGLSLPFYIKYIGYSSWWQGAFVLGFAFQSSTIILSAIALTLAVAGQRTESSNA